ncbi:MAG: hypothetical protein OXH39_10250, partial [Candidatus Poribacteria bacterium]|nr:hypothetical protein [Candidatus Poribacteria bacterium]
EHFKPFAFAYFGDSDTEDWYVEVLNIFTWTQGNTRINTGFEHDLSALFFSEKPFTESDDSPEIQKVSSDYRSEPNPSKDLLIKLKNTGTPLGRYGNIYSGISLGHKSAFLIDEYTYERLLAEDRSCADLIEQFPDKPRKWRWESSNAIYIPSSKNKRWPWSGIRDESEAERIFETTYPAISKHLRFYKDRLKKKTNPVVFYWEFPPRNIYDKLKQPKIIYRATHTSMQAAYDTSHRLLSSATLFIPTKDLSLLAILNSKLFGWFAHKECRSPNPEIKRLSFSKQNMEKIPVASQTAKQKADFSNLVQRILEAPDSPEVSDIERKIDQLIYELYELTPAEIVLIEEETNQ